MLQIKYISGYQELSYARYNLTIAFVIQRLQAYYKFNHLYFLTLILHAWKYESFCDI